MTEVVIKYKNKATGSTEELILYDGNAESDEVKAFVRKACLVYTLDNGVHLKNRLGVQRVYVGDYIAKRGEEFFPVSEGEFKSMYTKKGKK